MQFCSIFRPPSIWTLRPSVAEDRGRTGLGEDVRGAQHGEVPEAPPPNIGSLPPCLGVPRGLQVVLQEHFLEHMADICPFVQILDGPVPQMVHFFRSLDTQLPVEQAIDVPKISDDIIQPRLVDRHPQIAEQLVDVPTVLSCALLQQRTAVQLASEQIVNIPVPPGRRDHEGLCGFLRWFGPCVRRVCLSIRAADACT